MNNSFSVWEGVFSSFAEAGGDQDAFDTPAWLERQKQAATQALSAYLSGTARSRDYPLATVLAILVAERKRLNVLDFGGGLGVQALDCLAKVPLLRSAEFDCLFQVLDGAILLNSRPPELDQVTQIRFCLSMDEVSGPLDVLHIGSTLQYVEDWKELLKTLLSRFRPNYLILSDLVMGAVPTFVSRQKFMDKRIAVNFFNAEDMERFLTLDCNHEILYRSQYVCKILGSEEVFPNADLPETHRIERTSHLVLRRKG